MRPREFCAEQACWAADVQCISCATLHRPAQKTLRAHNGVSEARTCILTGPSHGCRKEGGEKGKGFGKAEPAAPASTSGQQKVVLKQDKKWELRPSATNEWEAWVQEQREASSIKGDDDFYAQVPMPPSLYVAPPSCASGSISWRLL